MVSLGYSTIRTSLISCSTKVECNALVLLGAGEAGCFREVAA